MVKLPFTVNVLVVPDVTGFKLKVPPLIVTLVMDWLVVKFTVIPVIIETSSPAPGTTAEAGPPIDVDHVAGAFQFPVALE